MIVNKSIASRAPSASKDQDSTGLLHRYIDVDGLMTEPPSNLTFSVRPNAPEEFVIRYGRHYRTSHPAIPDLGAEPGMFTRSSIY